MHLRILFLVLLFAVVLNLAYNRYHVRREPLGKVAALTMKANLRELIRRADAGDHNALEYLLDGKWNRINQFPISRRSKRLQADYQRLFARIQAEDFYNTNRDHIAELVLTAQLNQRPAEDIVTLSAIVEALVALKALLAVDDSMSSDLQAIKLELAINNRATYTNVATRLEQRATRLINLLWGAAQNDREAFMMLMAFMERSDIFEPQRMRAEQSTIDPKAWNQLVARYFKNPTIELFCLRHEFNPGDLRTMAAEALIDEDFTTAKLILAYCYLKPKRIVGDVKVTPGLRGVTNLFEVPKLGFGYEVGSLAGELARMVVRLERSMDVNYAS